MDPIIDRTQEHLASSDRMVMLTRRVLLNAVKDYQKTGKLPPVLTIRRFAAADTYE